MKRNIINFLQADDYPQVGGDNITITITLISIKLK